MTNPAAVAAWTKWRGEWETFFYRAVIYGRGYREFDDGSNRLLLGGVSRPEDTIDSYGPDAAVDIIRYESSEYEADGWVHRFDRAYMLYIAYPLKSEAALDGLNEDNLAAVCDFKRGEFTPVHTGNGKALGADRYAVVRSRFEAACRDAWAAGDRRPWVLVEEAFVDEYERFNKWEVPDILKILEVRQYDGTQEKTASRSQTTGPFRRWCDRHNIPQEQRPQLWEAWVAGIRWRDRLDYGARERR